MTDRSIDTTKAAAHAVHLGALLADAVRGRFGNGETEQDFARFFMIKLTQDLPDRPILEQRVMAARDTITKIKKIADLKTFWRGKGRDPNSDSLKEIRAIDRAQDFAKCISDMIDERLSQIQAHSEDLENMALSGQLPASTDGLFAAKKVRQREGWPFHELADADEEDALYHSYLDGDGLDEDLDDEEDGWFKVDPDEDDLDIESQSGNVFRSIQINGVNIGRYRTCLPLETKEASSWRFRLFRACPKKS